MTWINTSRAKTDIAVNVPLLGHAKIILGKFMPGINSLPQRETVFPKISNQEINRSLKLIDWQPFNKNDYYLFWNTTE